MRAALSWALVLRGAGRNIDVEEMVRGGKGEEEGRELSCGWRRGRVLGDGEGKGEVECDSCCCWSGSVVVFFVDLDTFLTFLFFFVFRFVGWDGFMSEPWYDAPAS